MYVTQISNSAQTESQEGLNCIQHGELIGAQAEDKGWLNSRVRSGWTKSVEEKLVGRFFFWFWSCERRLDMVSVVIT